ncbi:TonB-dependent receptor [Mucilaginibacter sp. SP1R1]|uniref:TonB-dependent receptor n=1 Tax=Mucilaginibacter sp. SP1R1 TaxID=2723091 RepID=UPI001609FDB3|nr:TonB-dependent receptor [Mucilaginibacter sp. SP1R1]MBB6151571.1 iron complex outermembrane receptor protein [Mucilaginibacter sp. SP1R1]
MNYLVCSNTSTSLTLKKIYFTFLFLCFAAITFAQTGTISGSVKTSDGNAAQAVSIAIKGTSKGTLTDQNGKYLIRIKPGTYQLTAFLIGLTKEEQTVEVKSGENATTNFILKESSAQLNEVTISGRNANKVNDIVAKMPLKKLENAQVYSVVSSEIMKQQGITNFDDAMRNIPGISRTWESTGRSGDGASYFALRGFEAQPSLYNGLPGFTNGDLDPADIEEIQVLKGPSATLFGANFVGYGGIINVVTKKPYFTTGGEITYNTGSFGLNRISADVNTPLSKTEKIALRVNTAYSTENSFQDAGYKKTFFFAPALVYQANDRLTFNFMTEILQEDRAVAPVFFNSNRADPLTAKNLKELNLDNFQSFTSNDLSIKNPRFNIQGQMQYKISSQWTSQTVISRGSAQSKGYYGYIYGNDYGSNEFSQYIHKENQTSNTTDIQQNFNSDFKIGNLRNRLLIGLDYFNRNVIDNGTGYALMRMVTPQGAISYPNPAHPVYTTQNSVDSLLAGSGASHSNTSNSSYSAYVSDVINFTPSLSAMLSLRADYFDSKGEKSDPTDNFHQFALSPKFGLVYQPVLDKVSLFANYLNSFLNVQPSQVSDADGSNPHIKSFKPEHANQVEFGVKTNLFSDRLSATVSYYDTRVANKVTPIVGNINDSDQRGKVKSNGFEFDLNANPVEGLNLIAGYSHNHIQNISSNGNDFYTEQGRAPGGQGPQDLANLWATYKFTHGSLKDFGFGVGGNYAGVYKVIDNSVTGVFELPSYTLLNASLFYNADRYRFSFNANNITNEKYYIGYWSVNPQRPVNFTASMAFKF